MSLRAFKYFSIAAGGTPQPLVGTKITSAASPTSNPADIPLNIAVADSSMFQVGDWAVIDTGVNEERLFVTAIPDGTHVTTKNMIVKHASGVYFRLSVLRNSLTIQCQPGNSGPLYIGLEGLVVSTGVKMLVVLEPTSAGIQPTIMTDTRAGLANADDLGEIWIDGTTNDKYLPSIGTV